jgi:hypothetical protein
VMNSYRFMLPLCQLPIRVLPLSMARGPVRQYTPPRGPWLLTLTCRPTGRPPSSSAASPSLTHTPCHVGPTSPITPPHSGPLLPSLFGGPRTSARSSPTRNNRASVARLAVAASSACVAIHGPFPRYLHAYIALVVPPSLPCVHYGSQQ